MSKLNTARADASACVLKGIVYVFCGTVTGYPYCINSIEAISETLLVSKVKACWQLIETPLNILAPRSICLVAPINDNEIAILGGCINDFYSGDIVVFNTTTNQCMKAENSGIYKFGSGFNQCVQAGKNKVVALVVGEVVPGVDRKSAVISWTKGASSVTIIAHVVDKKL